VRQRDASGPPRAVSSSFPAPTSSRPVLPLGLPQDDSAGFLDSWWSPLSRRADLGQLPQATVSPKCTFVVKFKIFQCNGKIHYSSKV